MTMESRRRWAIETDLHKAIERQELVLYFQPQVDVRTGRLVGAEALMRWNRGGQLVPPNDFIGIAQECGLIIPMGEWAVWRTAHQIREWRDAGFGEMQVAVNISSSHFTRADLCATVKRVSEETGVRAGLIEIEITETVLMQDLALTTETLFDLTRMGVKLSVDDFGTGYSSLAYLKRFPISELKIDRSFVHGLAAGSENEAIVSAIIAMARSLQLEVVAEGVETAEEVALLHRAGCHIMQGYYFGKPVAAEEFGRLMAEENRDGRHEKWVFLGRNKVVGLPRPGRATVNS
jgi:EAL domain-containing protein (putative c-di-GMP-specific phosphodiesterase class I)